jgi:hypothetical protein
MLIKTTTAVDDEIKIAHLDAGTRKSTLGGHIRKF